MGKWIVLYRRDYTQSQVHFDRYETQQEAERVAHEYNKCNQDSTWNAIVAVVHYEPEKVYA